MNSNNEIRLGSESYKITPTPDLDSPTGVYIPIDVVKAIAELDRMLPVTLKLKIDENSIDDYNFTLGLWLRNNWGLATQNHLVQYLTESGCNSHPDDLSRSVLDLYALYLHHCFSNFPEDLIDIFFELVSERLKQLFDCNRAILWLVDYLPMQLVTTIPLGGKLQDIRIPSNNVGFSGKVFTSGKTLNIPFDLYDDPDIGKIKEGDLKTGHRTCSTLVVPILSPDDKIVGIIQLMNKKKPGVFAPYNPEDYPQAPECWQNSFTKDDEALLERFNPQILTLLNHYLQQSKWRKHPKLIGRMSPEYPNDLQVIVHDGDPRLTNHNPELVWVNITKCDANIFSGRVLNQPNQLTSVSEGSNILFIVPDSGDYPLLVTEKYLQERSEWIIHPCDRCGLSELFDPPSVLIRAKFPNVPTTGAISMFTAFCGFCGGVQGVENKSYNSYSETIPSPELFYSRQNMAQTQGFFSFVFRTLRLLLSAIKKLFRIRGN